MSKQIFVRPGEGRRVRLPDGRGRAFTEDNTPAGGVAVPFSIYVQRRLACGDLVEVKAPPAAAKAPATASMPDVKGA